MSALVEKLCSGLHPVEVSLRPRSTSEALRACLNRAYVHIKFTDTQGGTELGIRLNANLTQVTEGDVPNRSGKARFVGDLTLDCVPVRCFAEIDLSTLSGTGHLERLYRQSPTTGRNEAS